MPVTVTRTISITDKEGNISILTESDQIAESTDILARCDSSRCASRHGNTVEIVWNVEAIKEKSDALPDAFFRMISLILDPRNQTQKVFCSAGCARDFLQYDYVAPLSPREEAVLQATNQQAELAKHRPKTTIIQFPVKPTGKPLEINSPTDAPPVGQSTPLVSIDTEEQTPAESPVEGPKPFSDTVAPFDPVYVPFLPREGA